MLNILVKIENIHTNKNFKKKSEIRKEKIKNQTRAELKFNIKIPQEEGAVAHNLKIILYFYPGLC